MAKQTTFSKFAPAYWTGKVFRPAYTRDGESREVSEFYVRIQYAGRRENIGLATNERHKAAQKAVKVYQTVRAKGWEETLKEFAPDRAEEINCVTVGQYLQAVEKFSGLNPKTCYGYSAALRTLVARAFGLKDTTNRYDYKHGGNLAWRKRVESIRLIRITKKRLESALAQYKAGTENNPAARRQAEINAASLARQARSLFSQRVIEKLPIKTVHNPFEGIRVEAGRPEHYTSTFNMAELAQAARRELLPNDVEAYKAFLLAFGAGLRKREIDNLTKTQLDYEGGRIYVTTTAFFTPKTMSSEGSVYVDATIMGELKQLLENTSDVFVLQSHLAPKPGHDRQFYRAEKTFQRLVKWLRKHGITAQKPIHTLRKEFGSYICEHADILAASRQLRHGSLAVTSAYYLENRKRIAPSMPSPTLTKEQAA
ncbi:MAG: hypothetical protein K0Q55_2384 [Verrucomicrobia bacterium]|jgi:site-specific recombinase XerC|nr:hypothetical protein [Verrucomicrobiota bacterium]